MEKAKQKFLVYCIHSGAIVSHSILDRNNNVLNVNETKNLLEKFQVQTYQDSNALFDQLLLLLNLKKNEEKIDNRLAKTIVFLDLSSAFLESQKAETTNLLGSKTNEGFYLTFSENEKVHFVSFAKSSSMSKKCLMAFIDEKYVSKMRTRMSMGFHYKGEIVPAKFYAYTGLFLSGGKRIDNPKLKLDQNSVFVAYNSNVTFIMRQTHINLINQDIEIKQNEELKSLTKYIILCELFLNVDMNDKDDNKRKVILHQLIKNNLYFSNPKRTDRESTNSFLSDLFDDFMSLLYLYSNNRESNNDDWKKAYRKIVQNDFRNYTKANIATLKAMLDSPNEISHSLDEKIKKILTSLCKENTDSQIESFNDLKFFSNSIAEANKKTITLKVLFLNSETFFDGEGMVSPEYSDLINESLHGDDTKKYSTSFQIRMPYIKGMLHKVNFKAFFDKHHDCFVKCPLKTPLSKPFKNKENTAYAISITEGGKTSYYLLDAFSHYRSLDSIQIILSYSQLKLNKIFENQELLDRNSETMETYFTFFEKYSHALYICNGNNNQRPIKGVLNYQFLATSDLNEEEAINITKNELDNLYSTTNSTIDSLENSEDQEINEEVDDPYQSNHIEIIGNEYISSHDVISLVKKYPSLDSVKFIHQLANKQKNDELNQMKGGRIHSEKQTRYLSCDLLFMLYFILGRTDILTKNRSSLPTNQIYVPGFVSANNSQLCVIERNPHITKNENVLVAIANKDSVITERDEYFKQLTGVVMINAFSNFAMRLGGADFDGDIAAIITNDTFIESVQNKQNYKCKALNTKYPTIEITPLDTKTNTGNSNKKFDSLRFSKEDLYELLKNTFKNSVGTYNIESFKYLMSGYSSDDQGIKKIKNNIDDLTAEYLVTIGQEIDAAKHGVKPKKPSIDTRMKKIIEESICYKGAMAFLDQDKQESNKEEDKIILKKAKQYAGLFAIAALEKKKEKPANKSIIHSNVFDFDLTPHDSTKDNDENNNYVRFCYKAYEYNRRKAYVKSVNSSEHNSLGTILSLSYDNWQDKREDIYNFIAKRKAENGDKPINLDLVQISDWGIDIKRDKEILEEIFGLSYDPIYEIFLFRHNQGSKILPLALIAYQRNDNSSKYSYLEDSDEYYKLEKALDNDEALKNVCSDLYDKKYKLITEFPCINASDITKLNDFYQSKKEDEASVKRLYSSITLSSNVSFETFKEQIKRYTYTQILANNGIINHKSELINALKDFDKKFIDNQSKTILPSKDFLDEFEQESKKVIDQSPSNALKVTLKNILKAKFKTDKKAFEAVAIAITKDQTYFSNQLILDLYFNELKDSLIKDKANAK